MAGEKIVATNPKAFHDYFVSETPEAGMVLFGTEVKALREGRAQLRDSFARVEKVEMILYHCHQSMVMGTGPIIIPNDHVSFFPSERNSSLMGKTQKRGLTLVPLKTISKMGGRSRTVGPGKKHHDKREVLKARRST